MTEYGRGSGSQPWHPEDPLYGDQGWDGGRPAAQQGEWDPYAGEQYQQQPYPQQHQQQYQGQQYQGRQQPYPGHQDPYGQQQGQHGQQGQPYYQPQHQQPPYGDGGWDTQGGGRQQPYPGHQDPYGQQHDPYATGGHPQHDPYATGGHPQHDPYAGRQQGHHPAEHAYAQPAPPQREQPPRRPGPDQDTGWDAGPDQGEHAFFADRDEDDGQDDYDDPDAPDGRRGRTRRGGTKRKGGCACLVVALGLAGGLGTIGYFGYQFYESRFGDAPDYSGSGHGTVQVEIPEGSSLSDMGNILKKAGIVKSHDAFVAAAEDNGKSAGIHAGVFTMKKEMSASAALEMMLDPASQSALIIPEGLRATQIYELIDKKLEKKKGTTKKAAAAGGLGLPEWADGNPEGLLFPAKYTVGQDSSPQSVLKGMVKRAEAEYRKADLETEARKLGKDPRDIIAIASLIQAEAQEDADFGKVSRVIYNRLEKPMALQFDSTINYAKGESKLNTTVEDTKFDSPYNTYLHDGLPPGPIDNPGNQAIEAALNPAEGDWLFFVSVKPGDTRFTDDHAEHERNVQDFNDYQREKRNGG
ncbi:endolytic transglycosylase MltG [Streptomyces armeniacus]|uniref:Endolytic murein transglycosylase n=1 Tax=Streptomyces armeniacus TaxID=83291 RepID=A0A345XL72_9ACTN|nr:endolytic transglycosylase MltG [Streptomyces armeniacus]AXK32388.1 endolytic transglycosylase MltG [Streptomyces armeniacus]